ncbi:MAG TPA: MFS transporter, partial [Solirubrobacteraceae bacterium]|nr:MFS transporter [Solirubrobacteraceae bacterium]
VEALLTLALAALLWRFSFAGVLIFVAIDGTVAVAATALVRAAAARAAAAQVGAQPATALSRDGSSATADLTVEAQRRANAALNVAFMVSLWLGPAIGGVLVHWFGGPVALVLDALSFLLCALLMLGLRTQAEDGADGSTVSRLRAAWRHLRAVPTLRVLLVTEAVAVVVFASVEPVEVVFVKSSLQAGDLGFGLLVAAWGFGAALGAIAFSRSVRRPLGPMLTGGALLVGLAYLGFALAPSLALACAAAVVGGAGNGIQWPSFISAVQQLTPAALHGRLMSMIGSLNALCPALGFAVGGTIAALASPRVAMLVAGLVAGCATLGFLRTGLGDLHSIAQEPSAIATEPGLIGTSRQPAG